MKQRKRKRGKINIKNLEKSEMSKKQLVTRMLFSLGFRVNCKGFYYIREEILLASENKYKRISKLHEEVASASKEEKLTPSKVEGCIRTAINKAWANKKEKIQKLTGEENKPTPSRLIFEIANKINDYDK